MSDAAVNDALDNYGFVALAGCLSLIQLNIIAGESVCGSITAILWIILSVREARRPEVPRFFLPLLALAGWTLLSTLFSADIRWGLHEDKQLLLYLIVPASMRLARGARATTAVNAIIAVGSVAAIIGIVQYAVLGFDNLNHRPHGLLGHYMTYSGILLLVTCAAGSQLVYRRRDWLWPAVAVPALLVALGLTLTRNAWIGAGCAILLLLGLRRRQWLLGVPVIVAIALLVPTVRARALSIVDLQDATNRDRISMLKSGVAMIKDHPLFGVGPNLVPREYLAHYKRTDAVDPVDQPNSTRAHLHNVPVQLAAERGLPALAIWVWFLVVAVLDLSRLLRKESTAALAAGALAAVVAMVAAGMFEHNFGDSEFLILFLGLITLPFAAAVAPAPTGAVPVPVLVGRGPTRAARASEALPE
jgi:O-antigen ligase